MEHPYTYGTPSYLFIFYKIQSTTSPLLLNSAKRLWISGYILPGLEFLASCDQSD